MLSAEQCLTIKANAEAGQSVLAPGLLKSEFKFQSTSQRQQNSWTGSIICNVFHALINEMAKLGRNEGYVTHLCSLLL